MPYQRRTEAEKRRLVAAWRQSGLPKTRFARERDLCATVFSRWIRRYDAPGAQLPTFATVEIIPEPPAPRPLVVELASTGHRVEVPWGFDAGELRRLLGVLC